MVAYAEDSAEKAARKREKEKAREQRAHRALEKSQDRVRKENLKSKPDLKKEAQAAINKYRRLSDLKAGFMCICCGKPFEPSRPGGSVDAGHYLSRGSHPNLAFVEMNINAQRKSCNMPGGTTAASFRQGMIERYGLEAVERLEADKAPRHYTADDYREIRDKYLALIKTL